MPQSQGIPRIYACRNQLEFTVGINGVPLREQSYVVSQGCSIHLYSQISEFLKPLYWGRESNRSIVSWKQDRFGPINPYSRKFAKTYQISRVPKSDQTALFW